MLLLMTHDMRQKAFWTNTPKVNKWWHEVVMFLFLPAAVLWAIFEYINGRK